MSTTVRIEFDTAAALARRGLGPSNRTQQVFTSECARHMDKYVPMREGLLKNTKDVEDDRIIFVMPYSRYHYYGKLMLAPNGSSYAKLGERKVLTERDMLYHGAPVRGPFWDKRTWADNKDTILDVTVQECGGRYK